MSTEHLTKFRKVVTGRCRQWRRSALLSPTLIEALTELATTEDLPLPTLIAVLINEALTRRLQRGRP